MFSRSIWPLVIWSAVMLTLSGIPGNYIPRIITFRDWLGPDKLVHLAMFGIFAWLLLRYLLWQYSARKHRFLISAVVVIIGTIFGFILEAMQLYVFAGRNGNRYDLAADIVGLFAGIAVFYIFFERNKRTDTK
jgi:VanZ family protein